MPDDRRHESAGLGDYEVLDGTGTLNGAPGDDPLDRGVVTPGTLVDGDQIRPGRVPGSVPWRGGAGHRSRRRRRPDDTGWDENATEEDIARLSLEQGPEPRAGRLAAEDEVVYDTDEAFLIGHEDRLARDESIDGGGRRRAHGVATSRLLLC